MEETVHAYVYNFTAFLGDTCGDECCHDVWCLQHNAVYSRPACSSYTGDCSWSTMITAERHVSCAYWNVGNTALSELTTLRGGCVLTPHSQSWQLSEVGLFLVSNAVIHYGDLCINHGKLEINMHQLGGKADSDEILWHWGIPKSVLLSNISTS